MSDGRQQTVQSVIEHEFDKIGKDTASMPTKGKKNTDPIAWEFYVAGLLRTLSDKRYDKAKKNAETAGVLLSKDDVVEPGSVNVVYDSSVVTITLQVNTPAERLDKSKLVVELTKLGVSMNKIEKAMTAATVTNTPARVYKASPK